MRPRDVALLHQVGAEATERSADFGFGLASMAPAKAAFAPSRSPLAWRASPRLLCATAYSGASFTARRRSRIAASSSCAPRSALARLTQTPGLFGRKASAAV